ncbi:hypothetical protein ANN_15251 [Periplaneta americana]|uniref:Uncharacterized protein n=1 Tax=Periplaneta americana TaxID=6978 RepID=A0ABQ8SGI6_PERAM|nr:hypothetical protein ANN_15251 [Periplaneta americana]
MEINESLSGKQCFLAFHVRHATDVHIYIYYKITVLFEMSVETEEELLARIVAACNIVRMTPGLLDRVRKNFVRRCHVFITAGGCHCEQLLYLKVILVYNLRRRHFRAGVPYLKLIRLPYSIIPESLYHHHGNILYITPTDYCNGSSYQERSCSEFNSAEQSDGITVFRISTMTSLMLHRCHTGSISLQRSGEIRNTLLAIKITSYLFALILWGYMANLGFTPRQTTARRTSVTDSWIVRNYYPEGRVCESAVSLLLASVEVTSTGCETRFYIGISTLHLPHYYWLYEYFYYGTAIDVAQSADSLAADPGLGWIPLWKNCSGGEYRIRDHWLSTPTLYRLSYPGILPDTDTVTSTIDGSHSQIVWKERHVT